MPEKFAAAQLERAAEAYYLAGWYPNEPTVSYAALPELGRRACRVRAQFILEAAHSDTGGMPTCIDCNAPRSIGSAGLCRQCYLARAAARREGGEKE